jgi:predicted transposase YbfD/YdcC
VGLSQLLVALGQERFEALQASSQVQDLFAVVHDRLIVPKFTEQGKRNCLTVTGKETTTETRYFIGSRKASAKVYGRTLRRHWSIENNLHWQLDVSFGEDNNRVSKRHEAENLALLRRLSLTLLKQHPDKRSIACKRLAAALNTGFLEEVLRGGGVSGKP